MTMIMTIMILMMMVSRVGGRKMAEAKFPSVSRDKYESPGKNSLSGKQLILLPVLGLFPRLRKLKSMQPKTLEEDYEAAR